MSVLSEVTGGVSIEHVRECLRDECDKNGSQKATAKKCKISQAYLNDMLHGRRAISTSVLRHLGFKKVVRYASLWLLLLCVSTPSYAAQVCTDAGEFQTFALSHKAKDAEIKNLLAQIQLYIKNTGNLKEQNGLLKKEVALLQEAVEGQKKLNISCEVLIDEHKTVLNEAIEALEEAKRESWIKTGRDIGIGLGLSFVASRIPGVKWLWK